MRKKICVVTGSRAEYGLFAPLLKMLKSWKQAELQIIATGMHLSSEFGLTYKEVERDGFRINKRIKILLFGDTEEGIAKSIGLGITRFAEVFKDLKPDLVLLFGDRFETFGAAVAAFVANIPIAHIHGGELTEGLIDDAFRHSITKMSVLHFTSTEAYRRRVMQLGESPASVFKVGALGIDNIHTLDLLPKETLEKKLGFTFKRKNILVTFHPVTLEKDPLGDQFKNLLCALNDFTDLGIIFTKANADTNGKIINKLIDDYVKDNPERTKVFPSLGQLVYLSVIRCVDAVVGNSSSGIIEVPSLGKPTVNIGDRQRGRLRAKSVIDCLADKKSIVFAIRKAFSKEFLNLCHTVSNPYGDGHAAGRIIKIIKEDFSTLSAKKSFYDVRFRL